MAGNEITFAGFLNPTGTSMLLSKDRKPNTLSSIGVKNNFTSNNVLIDNWNEDTFDIDKLSKARCLPSQHDHYFETTYKQSYSKSPPGVPEVLKYRSSLGERFACTPPGKNVS